jgi:hypothetical protein
VTGVLIVERVRHVRHVEPEEPTALLLRLPAVGQLAGSSESALRRYAAEVRQVPHPVARRIHFLVTLAAILHSSFNEFGIRRWFERSRTLATLTTPVPDDLWQNVPRGK